MRWFTARSKASLSATSNCAETAVGASRAMFPPILIVWPGTGVVAISWVIAVVALLLAALLIFLALCLKRLQARVDTIGRERR